MVGRRTSTRVSGEAAIFGPDEVGCTGRWRLYGASMKKDLRKENRTDDLELFERAMETLGVKPQPREDGPSKARGKGPQMPLVPDDGLDFDALMRTSRGPAVLERPPKKPTEPKTEADGGVAHPPHQGLTPGVDVRAYEPSAEERALFLEAMQGEVVPSGREASAPTKAQPARVEPLASRIKRRVPIEAQLDLHGRTKAEAEPRVRAFLEECVAERWELVAIVCGRGVHSDGGKPVLKPMVTRWLREDLRELAAEIAEAPAAMGGSGTLIVRVRLDANA